MDRSARDDCCINSRSPPEIGLSWSLNSSVWRPAPAQSAGQCPPAHQCRGALDARLTDGQIDRNGSLPGGAGGAEYRCTRLGIQMLGASDSRRGPRRYHGPGTACGARVRTRGKAPATGVQVCIEQPVGPIQSTSHRRRRRAGVDIEENGRDRSSFHTKVDAVASSSPVCSMSACSGIAKSAGTPKAER